MKKIRQILSVILATAIFMGIFSVSMPVLASEIAELNAEAQTQDNLTADSMQSVLLEESGAEGPVILDEIYSLRDEYTKVFRQSDGTYLALRYPAPVHYEEAGQWKEYDMSLVADGDDGYTITETDTPIYFPERLTEGEISVETPEGVISFSPEVEERPVGVQTYGLRANTSEEALVVMDDSAEIAETDEKLVVDNQKSHLIYENVYEGVNMEYEVTGKSVKESIILNNSNAGNVFTFRMDLGGLYPEKQADGSINLCSDAECENVVSVLTAPYMFDSNGVYSYDVDMTIVPDGEEYVLTVTADELWLEDSERAYPVVIDPTIIVDVGHRDTIDGYVDSTSPNGYWPFATDLYAGKGSNQTSRSFIKFELPSLPIDGCVIQNVSLNLFQMSAEIKPTNSKRYIAVYEVLENWDNDENTPTYAEQPDCSPDILDYAEMKSGGGVHYTFDITEAAKKWFENGNNYGVMVKGLDESLIGRAQFRSAEYSQYDTLYPTVSITYRSNRGLESYWSYTGFSAGTAGSAVVNNYSGELVYQLPIMSTVSEILPVSLGITYNSSLSGVKYTVGLNGSNLTTPGKGFRFNVQQTVIPSTEYGLTGDNAAKYPYVYTDGDGTEHYFQKVTKKDSQNNTITTYEDEDGLGLTLERVTDGSATYKITDKLDNVYLFNAKGNLFRITDANDNRLRVSYDENKTKIEKVVDGTGHTLTFTYYDGQDYVKSIKDNANREVTFNITDGYLRSVTYYDGTVVNYVYESSLPGYINYAQSSDGNGINFDYNVREQGGRVVLVKEFSAYPDNLSNMVYGQYTSFDMSKYNTTVIRTAGINGVHVLQDSSKGNDDIINTLQFDNSGRTISQQISYADGTEVGAGAYVYTSTVDTADSKNKLSSGAVNGKNTVNLIENADCESLSGWVQNTNAPSGQAEHYTVTGIQYTGKYALALRNIAPITSAVNTNLGQQVYGWTAGETYTLSAFVRALNITQMKLGGLEGAYLQVSAYSSAGATLKNAYSQVLTATTEEGINNGFRRLSATIELPSNTAKVVIFLVMRNCTGSAYFDSVQLEKGDTPNSVNLLSNSGFEKYSGSTPTGWTKSDDISSYSSSYGTVAYSDAKEGTRALIIKGNPQYEYSFSQTIPVPENANDTYILSGWASANAVNSTYHSHYEKNGTEISDTEANNIFLSTDKEDDKGLELVEDSRFEIAVEVKYKDEDGNTRTQMKEPARFNTSVTEWQYSSVPVCLKYVDDETTTADDGKTYVPTHITVHLTYANQANVAYFDHVQLIKDVAQSYVYDTEGNVVSVSANAEQKNDMTYDPDSNDLKTYKDAGGNTTTFEYDDKHNLTTVTSPKGVVTEYTYNSKGQNTVTEVTGAGNGGKIKTETEYTAASGSIYEGAYVSSVKDQHGYETKYTYHMATGTVTKITDAENNTASYTYNSNYSELLRVQSQDTSVAYTYDGNRISSIAQGFGSGTGYAETYSFTYDIYGNVVNTYVGTVENGKVLSTNTYASRNGVLTESTYGNGDGIRYGYDYSGNITAIYIKNGSAYESTPSYEWEYSADGTPRKHIDNDNNLTYAYSYDSIGRLIRTDISGAYAANTEYGYNSRGHLISIENSIGGNLFAQYYSYSDTGVEGALANACEGLPTRYTALGKVTDYTYDALNRLTGRTIQGNGANLVTSYSYKDLPATENLSGYTTTQLATETINGVKYTYEYDKVGNIKKITKAGVDYRTYEYDGLGQLTSEIRHDEGIKVTNEYNHLGNIRFRKVYDWTPTSETLVLQYTYNYSKDTDAGWNYLLTSIVTQDYINNVTTTETVDYDQIGNPTSYRGATLAFNGRQLTSYTKGSTSISYDYDASGSRASKTVNGGTTVYQYVGDKLYFEQRPDGSKLYFFYDSYGNLTHLYHHVGGTMTAYNVLTNSQGDVIALYNWAGTQLVASYSYDAWGNCTITQDTTGIGAINPIRYRGYYFDSEIGMYYLQSRYYDPSTGRFINADGYITTGQGVLSYNMYAYCMNNPVMMSDPSGYYSFEELWEDGCELLYHGAVWVDTYVATPVEKYVWEPLVDVLAGDTDNIKHEVSDGNVKIIDSYKINNPFTMYKFLKENCDDQISGSIVGTMYEWYVHNAGYKGKQLADFLGTDYVSDKLGGCASVDFGSTIYADDHGALTNVMCGAYLWLCHPFAIYDYMQS